MTPPGTPPAGAPGRAGEDGARLVRGLLRSARRAAAAGEPLPGEHQLARELGSSRPAVRRGLARLEAQGVLLRRQGAATLVDPTALEMLVRLEDQVEHVEVLERLGYRAEVELLDSEEVPAPPALAAALGPRAGPRALRTLKRWRADGVAAMVAEDVLALPAGAEPGAVAAGTSVFAAAEQLWGEPVVWEVAVPGAVVLDATTAPLMEQGVGAPCLTLRMTGVAVSGLRLFTALEHHRTDLATYALVRTVRPPWRAGTGRGAPPG